MKPDSSQWEAAKRILRYDMDNEIFYGANAAVNIIGFIDSDLAGSTCV